ncbi:hypothetical protein MHYP_G00097050 [Metynnis hypsauchen]
MLNQGAVMIFTGICGALVVMAVAYYAYWVIEGYQGDILILDLDMEPFQTCRRPSWPVLFGMAPTWLIMQARQLLPPKQGIIKKKNPLWCACMCV